MKKVIIIASAVISALFAITSIGSGSEENLIMASPVLDSIITVIIALLIILISVLVIFNIKPPKTLRIPLGVISILMGLANFALFGLLLFSCISEYDEIITPIHIILCLATVPVTITLLTYIIRTLRPAKK